jgi:hypothetical protein
MEMKYRIMTEEVSDSSRPYACPGAFSQIQVKGWKEGQNEGLVDGRPAD